MTKNIVKISLLAAAILAAPALLRAQDTTTNGPAAAAPAAVAPAPVASDETTNAPAPVKPRKKGLVFRGTVGTIDTNAMTLTVGDQTYAITSDTKITKDGQPAQLGDGTAGEPVAGAYKKGEDGKLNATTVRFGAKGGKKKKETAAGN